MWQGASADLPAFGCYLQVSVSSSLTGVPIQSEDWSNLDEMVYQVGE
jgi:hypothetical protein